MSEQGERRIRRAREDGKGRSHWGYWGLIGRSLNVIDSKPPRHKLHPASAL